MDGGVLSVRGGGVKKDTGFSGEEPGCFLHYMHWFSRKNSVELGSAFK